MQGNDVNIHPHECPELQGLLQNGRFEKKTADLVLRQIQPMITDFVENFFGGYSKKSEEKTLEVLNGIRKQLEEIRK